MTETSGNETPLGNQSYKGGSVQSTMSTSSPYGLWLEPFLCVRRKDLLVPSVLARVSLYLPFTPNPRPILCSIYGQGNCFRIPPALRGLPQLSALVWCKGVLGDAYFSELGQQNLPLETLKLGNCSGVTGVGLGALRTVRRLKLHICSGISDAGLAAISSLPLLERLSLRSAEQGYLEDPNWTFTAEGLMALRGAASLRHLSLVDYRKQVGHIPEDPTTL